MAESLEVGLRRNNLFSLLSKRTKGYIVKLMTTLASLFIQLCLAKYLFKMFL